MKKSFLLSLIVILLSFATILTAQNNSKIAGKVFSNSEAEKLFGPVQTSVKVPVSELKSQLNKVNNYIMFKIKNNDVVIADSKRKLLRAERGVSLSANEVMHKYSKKVVKELLSKGSGDYVIFEMRTEKFSVTYGNFTMEMAFTCPPFCE